MNGRKILRIALAAGMIATLVGADLAEARGGRGGGGGGRAGGGRSMGGGGRSMGGGGMGGGGRSMGGGSGFRSGASTSISRPSGGGYSRGGAGGGGRSYASTGGAGGNRGNIGGGNRTDIGGGNRGQIGGGNRTDIGGGRTNVGSGNRTNVGSGNIGSGNTFNRNTNVNVDNGWGGWSDYPVGAGLAIGATAAWAGAATAAAIGSSYYALPPGCPAYGAYYHCGGVYYQPQYEGDTVVYVTVPEPAAGG
ncbi:MAG: hypothetical protein JO127_03790 [Caulobacteraceae bacterium]|nr:hypothetical protein [Caulobacteraceae bacterium]